MKIALVQYSPIWENKEKNQARILKILEKLASDVSVLVFPELTLTGFTMRSKKFAETDKGDNVNFFSAIARDFSTHVLAGFIEQIQDDYYNALIHLNNSGILLTKYHKIHPFTFTGEERHYASGNHPVVSKIGQLKIGLSICYDLRFPELYRQYAKMGADLLIDVANWPVERIEHWYALLKARAIENQSYVIGVNRVGNDKANHYVGWSTAFDPGGKEIVLAQNEETLVYVHIKKQEVQNVRKKFPFLNDIKLI